MRLGSDEQHSDVREIHDTTQAASTQLKESLDIRGREADLVHDMGPQNQGPRPRRESSAHVSEVVW